MKKNMELLMQFKFVWGLFYAAAIIIYTIVNMLLGKSSMEFIVVWQLMILTIVLVLIQYLIFGEFTLNNVSMKGKFLIHFILCYVIVLLFLNMFQWINVQNISSLGLYTGGYTLFYLGILNSLHIYYKLTGEELNSKLAVYKQSKNLKK
ncbi:DUF3021 family protein [Clostridium tunisiense]|uniref:DUF3021 family protein n=1 Tax=Clostridium tunisiense TaxID=219748 RepID=UPI0002D4316E|nr:DUF3021 family protein [Clostridium tunisiense]